MEKVWLLALLGSLAMATGCARKKTNDEAPTNENLVFAVEYVNATLAWRANTSRVIIAFTDEFNQSDKGVETWTTGDYCARNDKRTNNAVVHVIWSGPVEKDEPVKGIDLGGDSGAIENPFDTVDCSGGTSKIIKEDASDLDLTTLPVTKALKGGALVEYLSETPDGDNTVSLVISTPTADGTKTFTHKQSLGAGAVTVDAAKNADIPADSSKVVPTTTLNNVKPEAEFVQYEDNPKRIKVSFLGLTDPATGETIQLVANENIFLSEGSARLQKGLKVTQSRAENKLPVDLVFIVDNSPTMSEEADNIAGKISDFATELAASGVDARFACVGTYGDINGGINFTDVAALKTHLDRDSGTKRTEGFSGADAKTLEDKAGSFSAPAD